MPARFMPFFASPRGNRDRKQGEDGEVDLGARTLHEIHALQWPGASGENAVARRGFGLIPGEPHRLIGGVWREPDAARSTISIRR